MMTNTFYFPNKNKVKTVAKTLINRIIFDYKFKSKKDTYLENSSCLIVISKHFIRVLVFNDSQEVSDIKDIISNINKRT